MDIEEVKIKIKDLVDQYHDDKEDGVTGYGGKLNIRPKYQRNLVYDTPQMQKVVQTILKKRPLNSIYWAVNDDETYEVIDGQQRILSICKYWNGEFMSLPIENKTGKYYSGLLDEQVDRFLKYELNVYFCKGSDQERLDWFETINIAGEVLSKQELRNAHYAGPWVTDAKRRFGKQNAIGQNLGKHYMSGEYNRQKYLETVIKWISRDKIDDYMALHQNDDNADELVEYFKNVINWIEKIFIKKRPKMDSVDWGSLYNEYREKEFDSEQTEEEVAKLMKDSEVQSKSGIYRYIFTRDEKSLKLRKFEDWMIDQKYEEQDGICPGILNKKGINACDKKFQLHEMEADHIIPWSENGKSELDNCQMLCRKHNRMKYNK